ncbi:sugar phosphate isomerase/epimerase [Lewinella marina]|uniref:Xylose isomerase n=1 Tax=Neolewinella marina TaxID=438751 RepID=A0A2G0CIF7_9BACT|nr:sugar phosphate isomerase/epimerase family protein [Neolewinella marina]NJB85100.1 sugar phosphate isomerase/epimerase [Neolewinella marina]PHK99761.1 xylose isomerase [Neolewinella marina]
MPTDLSRLCIHSITTKPWPLDVAIDKFSAAGIGGISVWQDAAEAIGFQRARQLLEASPLEVVSYVRGGFFPHHSREARQRALDDNRRLLDEAASLGAPLLVLVCGAEPRQSLTESRHQIQAGIESLIDHAAGCGVKMAIEPLHPMYADTRSAINTLGQANRVAEAIGHEQVGIAVDVYHLWWDDQLEEEIRRCGANDNLYAFHICDWKVPTSDMLLDRGLMGEGCIDVPRIRGWVEDTGFTGLHEVEIFSNAYWASDQDEFLQRILAAYRQHS